MCLVTKKMNEYFHPFALGQVVDESTNHYSKFYGRVVGCSDSSSSLVVVEDRGRRLLVDISMSDSVRCEKGEWYRFLVERTGEQHEVRGLDAHSSTETHMVFRSLVAPSRCEAFDAEEYDKALWARSQFISQLDGLVGYALKHR